MSALRVTKAAITQLRRIISEQPDCIGLRIGIAQRGCSGLTYTLNLTKEKHKHDLEIVQDNIRIFLDTKAQLSLLGSEMDYKTDRLKSEFVFNNPNVTNTCGCGESFTIK